MAYGNFNQKHMAFHSYNYPTLATVMKNFPKFYVQKSVFIAKKIQL